MNKIFKFEQINSNELNINTINILNEHLTKHNATVFEVYENYILVSFDYFDTKSRIAKQKRILLYFDFNNLLIFIEDHKLFNKFTSSLLLRISKLVIIPIIRASMTMQRKSIILPLFAPNL